MDLNYSEHETLLVKLSEDYYLNDINFSELAKKYDLSRYKVIKYIEEAREKQIVTIAINSPFSRNYDLETIFSKYFPKTQIHILKSINQVSDEDLLFSKFAADYIQSAIRRSSIVSLSWGDTVYKVIDEFRPSLREEITFTQFIGEIGKYNSLAGSKRLVQKAAEAYKSAYMTLSIPLYVLNDTARSLMRLEPTISKTLTIASQSDLLISGIGTPSSIDSVDSWNTHKPLLFPDLTGHVGFLYGRPFDINGHFIGQDHDKTFGLSLQEILSIKQRIGLCNSKFKAEACIGALRGDFFSDLFLDEKTAWKILSILKDEH